MADSDVRIPMIPSLNPPPDATPAAAPSDAPASIIGQIKDNHPEYSDMSDYVVARHLYDAGEHGKDEAFPAFATRIGVTQSAPETALNTGLSSAAFHLNEPIESAIAGVGSLIHGHGFGEGYREKHQEISDQHDVGAYQNPMSNIGGNMVGDVADYVRFGPLLRKLAEAVPGLSMLAKSGPLGDTTAKMVLQSEANQIPQTAENQVMRTDNPSPMDRLGEVAGDLGKAGAEGAGAAALGSGISRSLSLAGPVISLGGKSLEALDQTMKGLPRTLYSQAADKFSRGFRGAGDSPSQTAAGMDKSVYDFLLDRSGMSVPKAQEQLTNLIHNEPGMAVKIGDAAAKADPTIWPRPVSYGEYPPAGSGGGEPKLGSGSGYYDDGIFHSADVDERGEPLRHYMEGSDEPFDSQGRSLDGYEPEPLPAQPEPRYSPPPVIDESGATTGSHELSSNVQQGGPADIYGNATDRQNAIASHNEPFRLLQEKRQIEEELDGNLVSGAPVEKGGGMLDYGDKAQLAQRLQAAIAQKLADDPTGQAARDFLGSIYKDVIPQRLQGPLDPGDAFERNAVSGSLADKGKLIQPPLTGLGLLAQQLFERTGGGPGATMRFLPTPRSMAGTLAMAGNIPSAPMGVLGKGLDYAGRVIDGVGNPGATAAGMLPGKAGTMASDLVRQMPSAYQAALYPALTGGNTGNGPFPDVYQPDQHAAVERHDAAWLGQADRPTALAYISSRLGPQAAQQLQATDDQGYKAGLMQLMFNPDTRKALYG